MRQPAFLQPIGGNNGSSGSGRPRDGRQSGGQLVARSQIAETTRRHRCEGTPQHPRRSTRQNQDRPPVAAWQWSNRGRVRQHNWHRMLGGSIQTGHFPAEEAWEPRSSGTDQHCSRESPRPADSLIDQLVLALRPVGPHWLMKQPTGRSPKTCDFIQQQG